MNKIYIAAGGTGGHINSAISLKESFKDDFEVIFISGDRYLDYQLLKNEKVIHLSGKPLRSKNIITIIKNILLNLLVFLKLFSVFLKDRPIFVIGTGGYICGPSLLVAKILSIPIFIVEQNAAAGLTNRILSKISNITFVSFPNTLGISDKSNVIVSGNPIRSSISFQKNLIKDKINILIFGGSLGAQQLNKTAEKLSELENVNILHQLGKNNLSTFESSNYKKVEYINDMQEAFNWSNIIISRSGAGSIFELDIIRKPTILVPFRFATDNHQYLNALYLKEKNDFFVEIVDPSLCDEQISEIIFKTTKRIIEENLFHSNAISKRVDANKIIREKILDYIKSA